MSTDRPISRARNLETGGLAALAVAVPVLVAQALRCDLFEIAFCAALVEIPILAHAAALHRRAAHAGAPWRVPTLVGLGLILQIGLYAGLRAMPALGLDDAHRDLGLLGVSLAVVLAILFGLCLIRGRVRHPATPRGDHP